MLCSRLLKECSACWGRIEWMCTIHAHRRVSIDAPSHSRYRLYRTTVCPSFYAYCTWQVHNCYSITNTTRSSATAEIARVGCHYANQGHSIGTNRKLVVCDFLALVNNILTYIVSRSHRFHVIADYWSNLRFRQEGVPLFDTVVWGELVNSGPWNLYSRNCK